MKFKQIKRLQEYIYKKKLPKFRRILTAKKKIFLIYIVFIKSNKLNVRIRKQLLKEIEKLN
jgi:hypothetical protein